MKGKAICKKCGKEIEINSDKVLTSLPPKYEGKCEDCKETNYYEVHEISWEFNLQESKLYWGENGLIGPKDSSTTFVPSPEHYNWLKSNQCNHVIDIKCTSGSFVTYCIKCGKIFDTKNCSCDYTTTFSGGLQ